MGRYLVTWKGPALSQAVLEKGYELWYEVAKSYPDIKDYISFGNLNEGHVLVILEAPGVERIHSLFEEFNSRFMGSELPESGESENEVGIDIMPLDFQYEGENRIYQREMAKSGVVI